MSEGATAQPPPTAQPPTCTTTAATLSIDPRFTASCTSRTAAAWGVRCDLRRTSAAAAVAATSTAVRTVAAATATTAATTRTAAAAAATTRAAAAAAATVTKTVSNLCGNFHRAECDGGRRLRREGRLRRAQQLRRRVVAHLLHGRLYDTARQNCTTRYNKGELRGDVAGHADTDADGATHHSTACASEVHEPSLDADSWVQEASLQIKAEMLSPDTTDHHNQEVTHSAANCFFKSQPSTASSQDLLSTASSNAPIGTEYGATNRTAASQRRSARPPPISTLRRPLRAAPAPCFPLLLKKEERLRRDPPATAALQMRLMAARLRPAVTVSPEPQSATTTTAVEPESHAAAAAAAAAVSAPQHASETPSADPSPPPPPSSSSPLSPAPAATAQACTYQQVAHADGARGGQRKGAGQRRPLAGRRPGAAPLVPTRPPHLVASGAPRKPMELTSTALKPMLRQKVATAMMEGRIMMFWTWGGGAARYLVRMMPHISGQIPKMSPSQNSPMSREV
ncbi:hypothetical protein TSOC_011093 [Tetrabaena socialis]|uniref:Uncharacterized protein n=1 Tax=Tetrabaena socialis TaxID=47790 RepID=A0A2J7ZRK4_9CHLO|nr:hypothetical protein TSOC_011093 [Tetrabaena socialis]|eukprot:PNH02893.1 hypothetical protein TSOC_011093 [Tetrabaena socialis]